MVLSGRCTKSVLDWGTESYKCVSVSWWCVSGDGVFSMCQCVVVVLVMVCSLCVSVSWGCISDPMVCSVCGSVSS